MPDIPASVVVTAVTTLISGGMGAILTNALNARRSNEEKIWELRRAAYGSILAELGAVVRVLDSADEYIKEDEMRYFHDDDSKKHDEIIASHIKLVREAYSFNYLIFSDPFIALFESFLRTLDDEDPNSLPPEEHKKFAIAVRIARPKLLRQARSEMPLRAGLWDRVYRRIGACVKNAQR